MNGSIASEIVDRIRRGDRFGLPEVLAWMNSDDLRVMGAVSAVVTQHKRLLDAELPMEVGIRFFIRYYRKCMVETPPEEAGYAHSSFLAARDLANWYKRLRTNSDVPPSALMEIREMVRDLFEAGDDVMRSVIVQGFLEHVFEDPKAVEDFRDWESSPRLSTAYFDALEWGREHETGSVG